MFIHSQADECAWSNELIHGCVRCIRSRGGYENIPHIEMYLSWACTQFLFISLFASISSVHTVAPLWVPFVCSAGDLWVSSLSSQAKQRRCVLSECCQELVSSHWARLTKWPVGGCVPVARLPSLFLSGHLLCVCGKAVEFVCSCILILRLYSSSHAWPREPPALLTLLVLIVLAWLAVCFWLHSLISIPLEANTPAMAAFRHARTDMHSFPPTVRAFMQSGEKKGWLWSANEAASSTPQ